jgi:uncharacterized protein YndB with AHSA1/START domain
MTSDVHELHTTSITTPSDTEIRIERTFDAPRELLWKAYTDPELLPEWLGPRDLTMSVDAMDLRPGGSYRYTHRDSAGNEYVFFGEYREVEPPKLLGRTFEFEGMPGVTSIERAEFEELDGERTKIVVTSAFPSKEDRDNMLQSGMERGVNEGYERLDELLARRPSQS